MANIVETSVFDTGVYKIETTDPVLGGVQTAIANKQAVSLANRTLYLKDRLDASGVQLSSSYAGNMNSLVNSGFYFIAAGATNKPSGVTTGYCLVINDSSTATLVQQLTDAATNTVWLRRITAGPTYNAWVKLRTEDTITATPVGYEGGWTEMSGFPVTLYRDGKICVCQGKIEGGSSGVNALSFGSSYAPSQDLKFYQGGDIIEVAASTCNIKFTGSVLVTGVDLNLTWRIP